MSNYYQVRQFTMFKLIFISAFWDIHIYIYSPKGLLGTPVQFLINAII